MTQAQPARDFNSLPRELRDMIWDAVIRDDRPAAHFLSTSTQKDVKEFVGECCIFGFNDGPSMRERNPHRRLSAATEQGLRQRFAQPAINPSAFLQDGGLWTACKESHEALRRRQKKRDHDTAVSWPAKRYPRNAGTHHPTMTGYFDNDGIRQYFAISANDLICWQPIEHDECVYLSCLPFYSHSLAKPYALQHFAFEFDPKWKHPEDVPKDEYIWQRMDFLGSVANLAMNSSIYIWFIDYGIQRDASLSTNVNARDKRVVFYGNGCRFLEVRSSESGWVYPRLEGGEPARATALCFAEQLDERMKDYDRLVNYERNMDRLPASNAWDEEIETREGAILGVLACEHTWSG